MSPSLVRSPRCFSPRIRQLSSSRFIVAPRECARSQSTSTNLHKEATKPKRSSARGFVVGLLFCGAGWALNENYQFLSFASSQPLNNSTFTPFTLATKEKVSSTSAIFTLTQPHIPPGTFEQWRKRGVWSIEIKQPQLQIARAYTPLPPLDASHPDDLRLLIRRERNGEVSGYLHAKPLTSDIHIRGPAMEYELPQNVEQVVFLAGGTGVAPAIQVAHALSSQARVAVLWANRKREDCAGGVSDHTVSPGWFGSLSKLFGWSHDAHAVQGEKNAVVRQLDALKAADNSLQVNYFVDDEGTFIRPQNVRNALATTQHQPVAPAPGQKIIFVSGPEGFINYWAGPKQWLNGREIQGPLGGALAHMDLRGWQVVKL